MSAQASVQESANHRYRVLIADSNDVYAYGVAEVLEIARTGKVSIVNHIRAAEMRLRKEKFDVVLIGDTLLPVPEQNLRAIQEAMPSVRVIVLYGQLNEERVVECYKTGVKAIVARSLSEDDLRDTLVRVIAGEEVIDREAREAILLSVKAENVVKRPGSDNPILTRKEQKIAYLIVTTGKRNKEIAADLSMTEQVVKNYLRNIYAKFNVNTRMELVLKLLSSPENLAILKPAPGD